VLFVDHAAAMGGAEWMLLDLARAYGDPHDAPTGGPQGEGARAVVLLEEGPFRRHLEQAGVPVAVVAAPSAVHGVRRGGGLAASLRAAPGVAATASRLARRARRYDVVYANSQKALVVGAVAARLAWRPLVWHLHDLLTADHFSRARRRLAVGLANRFAARVVCNSEATAAAFAAAGGDRRRTRVVYNGIRASAFDAVTDAETQALRRRLGVDARPLVGVFSRLAPWKGQHVLLDALDRLPGWQALLVGDALFAEDGPYAAALRARAAAPGLAGRVHFLGFRDDVPALVKACDVVAHTSVAPEPFGRVIVEGMLAGRPVVAADAGGAREIVEDGRTGRLVAPGDAGALAAALR
jgi:glycosyltransferase involved in cell wall biosynthesis